MYKIVLHRFVKKKFALDFIGLTKSLFKPKKEYPCNRNTLLLVIRKLILITEDDFINHSSDDHQYSRKHYCPHRGHPDRLHQAASSIDMRYQQWYANETREHHDECDERDKASESIERLFHD